LDIVDFSEDHLGPDLNMEGGQSVKIKMQPSQKWMKIFDDKTSSSHKLSLSIPVWLPYVKFITPENKASK